MVCPQDMTFNKISTFCCFPFFFKTQVCSGEENNDYWYGLIGPAQPFYPPLLFCFCVIRVTTNMVKKKKKKRQLMFLGCCEHSLTCGVPEKVFMV
jgi:hypothetical protein